MLVLMAWQFWSEAAPWFWKSADCTVLESGVREVEPGGDYAFSVRYAYAAGPLSAVESAKREGDTYAIGYDGGADYSDALRLALRHPPGSRTTGYVDPADPTRAVLEREVPWVLFMTPVPVAFIAIGVGGLWFTWRGTDGAKAAGAAPISSGASAGKVSAKGAWVLVAFFGVFFVVGIAVMAALGGGVLDALSARSWTPVPATVVSSHVRTHRGDSTTYSVNVLYAYRVNDKEYRSNRYGFMGGSSGGYEGKRQLVGQYAPGTRFTAYVNPGDPVDAVIERGWTWDMLLVLVPLVFITIGGVGMFFSARHARRATAAAAAGTAACVRPLGTGRPASEGRYVVPARPSPSRAGARAATLKPRQSPAAKLVGFSVFALIWNGILSVFLYQVFKGWLSGRGEVCVSIFLVPFVAVGLFAIAGALHSLLSLFNPRCEVTLEPAGVELGGAVEVKWLFNGRYDRIERLVLRVEGREEATYRQGTTTHTDKNVFALHELTDTTRAVDIRAGKTRWAVPTNAMHSFSAPNNKIAWVLCLHAHIRGWPDVKDEYVVEVAPLPKSRWPADAQDETQEEVEADHVAEPSAEPPEEPSGGRPGEESRWT